MEPRRPPSAVGLAAALLAFACGHPHVGADRGAPPAPGAVAAPPPAAVDAVAEPTPEDLPEPQVELPEITALAQARQVLAARARHRIAEEDREQVARVLADAEQELGLDVLLVLALITQESSFHPRAVGPQGSLGLMQVRPFVGRDVAARHGLPWAGDETLFEPAHNVRIGTLYLAELMEMFGDPEVALAAYNMGPYRVRRILRRGGAPTLQFADRVFGHYDGLVERYGSGGTAWGG